MDWKLINSSQCIAANFVEGSADAPDDCKNATSVSAYFTDDEALDALVGDSIEAGDSDGEGHDHDDGEHSHDDETGDATTDAPEETESPDAAASLERWSMGGLTSFVTVVTMMMFGGALMV